MADRVVITTADLEAAVHLRDAFASRRLPVELLTPTEELSDVEDPALLILTGDLDGKRARRLADEAAAMDRIPVIVLAASAAEAPPGLVARLRAVELHPKPVDPEEVATAGRRLIEQRRLRAVTGIVGHTEPMIEVLERVTQMAPVHSTVLITGESGTGKELVARGLHALSPRRHRPFIAANVAALSDTLLESELFGHEKGAFTGAIAQRKGFFELANGGTLFLDEIGEMPLVTQTKLLRVLEQREFMRVGGEEPIRVDVRVLAATNQPLRYLVERGEFRRDLYYRLNVLHIELPPLRERRQDIPLLVDEFIRHTSQEHDLAPVEISPEALSVLLDYDWPGNIRELRNLIESVVVLMPGRTITPGDIPPVIRGRRPALPVPVNPPAPPADRGDTTPALEFIFRMLVQLRVDMEELRRGFDEYRERHPADPAVAIPFPFVEPAATAHPAGREVNAPWTEPAGEDEDELDPERTVVFRPGMTMRDLEKEAIIVALKEAGGNRREAAELLGIGERTLYRKIKEFGIPL